MDLIFQYGDFYLASENSSILEGLLIASIGALIGAGLAALSAIYIFKKTLKAERDRDFELRNRRDKELLQYFSGLIWNIIGFADKQKSNYLKFAKDLKNKPFKHNHLLMVVNYDLKRVENKIDQNLIYHAYLNQIGAKNTDVGKFTKIYSNLDYIDSLIDLAMKENENGQKNIENISMRYKEIADILLRQAAHFSEKIKLTSPEDDNINLMCRIVDDVLSGYISNLKDPSDVVYYQGNLVVPLRDKLTSHLSEPNCEQIVKLAREATVLYRDIQLNSDHLAKSFEHYSYELAKAGEELKDKSKELLKKFGPKIEKQLDLFNQ